ncbi:MAG: hybrid sensor histidine kinase/response regulator [bacterium]|nr:hybrid sensor histidine kinase/response regulator [bacterium]
MWRQLSTKLTLLMIGIFLVTLAFAYLGFRQVMGSLELELRSLLAEKQTLYDKERSLRPFLNELALAQRLAKSSAIKRWSLKEADSTLKQHGIAELESYRNDFADQSYFFAIAGSGNYYFNDAHNQYDGRQLRYQLQPSNPEHQWFFRTLHQPKPCLLNVDYDEEIKVAKVWINCVVEADGRATAVIGTGLDLTTFITQVILDTQPGLSKFFINATTAIQAHQDTALIDFRSITKTQKDRKTLLQLISKESDRNRLRSAMAQLQGNHSKALALPLDIAGKHYMVGLAYIPQIGWYNVTLMEMGVWIDDDFFAPLGLLLALALLSLAGISTLMVKVLILNRVARLNQSTIMVAQGNYQVDLGEPNQDELGRLSASFTQMAQALDEHTNGLEQKVRERTANLEASNLEKERFISILAHDLRGPIGGLSLLFNDVMLKPADLTEELFDLVKVNTKSTYNLLTELLSWAQSQRGELDFNPVTLDLNRTLAENQPLYAAQAGLKQIELHFEVQSNLWVHADPAMVNTILRNLIHNALKFTPQGGHVTVKAEPLLGFAKVMVCDSGVGLSPDRQQLLFQPDAKVQSELGTASEAGTGMGLILCREFVKKCGGQIGLESQLGEGTTFWFTLPEATKPTYASLQTKAQGLRLLLLEPDKLHLETCSQVLRELGTVLTLAHTGTEAARLVSSQPFDLVLMSTDLQQLNGLEVAQKIRSDHQRTPKLIALSLLPRGKQDPAGQPPVFDGYLAKPLTKEAFLKLLEQLELPTV